MSDVGSAGRYNSVLMVGTSLDGRGGVASVVRIYKASGLFSRWHVTYLATHSAGGAARKLVGALSAWRSYLRWLLTKRFLLHVHSASRASFWRKSTFILPAVWTGRPVVFHLHGAEFIQFYEKECGPFKKRIVQYVLARCAVVVVLSESWRASIQQITTNKNVKVIANPAMPSAVEPAASARVPGTLLFLGRLGRRKGIYVLLKALQQVAIQCPDAKLYCGGDGEIEEVRDTARSLGLQDHVEVLGWIDEPRRTQLMALASIFVLPSFDEGLPMSILEAMSAGMPTVSTPIGGIPDAITDGEEGVLVPAGDAEALSSAICQLLSDPGLCQKMGSKARLKFDSCFNVEVVVPRIEAMYAELGVSARGPE